MAELTIEEIRKIDLAEREAKRAKKRGSWTKAGEVEEYLRKVLEQETPTNSGSSRFKRGTPPLKTAGQATVSMARGPKPSEA